MCDIVVYWIFALLIKERKMEECKKGNHPLVEITSSWLGYGGYEVVRWCPVCGSVVVDTDVDGRTMAGNVMKMRVPRIARERKHESI